MYQDARAEQVIAARSLRRAKPLTPNVLTVTRAVEIPHDGDYDLSGVETSFYRRHPPTAEGAGETFTLITRHAGKATAIGNDFAVIADVISHSCGTDLRALDVLDLNDGKTVLSLIGQCGRYEATVRQAQNGEVLLRCLTKQDRHSEACEQVVSFTQDIRVTCTRGGDGPPSCTHTFERRGKTHVECAGNCH